MNETEINCWEFKKCPQATFEKCAAYPDRGRDCWKITGTKCEKGLIEKKNIAEKIIYCRKCDFFSSHANKF